ncbi:hypothetical protein CDL15_Pgr014674 [Punica granatum]|uniref:Nuclear transport factor 2 n=1 Tax=Punica granatum TaxID=22663 RepID=A0A218Y1E4_PUNGR|nr:hypothetical protein CDL15_Pgr014674 [Punica granatum]
MAMQEAGTTSAPTARVVGNAFVEQYYHILHQSPGLVHRFYQDSSLLSRPDAGGEMTTVTTTQAINEKILSLNYEDFTAEIKTADAQESHGRGVIVLVTGCLTGKDGVRRNFTQTFFLAPQEKGYFVLNDVFRYLGENESEPINPIPSNGISDSIPAPASTPEPEPPTAPDQPAVEPATSFEEEDLSNGPEICDLTGNEESVVEDEAVEPQTLSLDTAPANEEDAPKKSYASILKVMQGNVVPHKVHAPSSTAKASPTKDTPQLLAKPPAPAPSGPSIDVVPESSTAPEGEGHSIYVKNLPYDATFELLEEVFKKFGPIKAEGIQGSCFGFVEFENQGSMQSALEASPILIGDRLALVEEKRANNRVEEGGFLLEEVGSGMRTSGAVEVLVEVGAMGEVNSEVTANFRLVLGPLWDEAEKVINEEPIRMGAEEADVVEAGTVGPFPPKRINYSRRLVAGKQF